jgi:hypothetical protein
LHVCVHHHVPQQRLLDSLGIIVPPLSPNMFATAL